MKIKSVLATIVAVAALSATAVFASADAVPTDAATTDAPVATADNAAPAESTKDNAETGVEGVAAVVGAIALAGAAVVISRKRA